MYFIEQGFLFQVSIEILWFKYGIKKVIDYKCFYYQLLLVYIIVEEGFDFVGDFYFLL